MQMITEVDVSESSQFVSELDVSESTQNTLANRLGTLANWALIAKRLVSETTSYRYQERDWKLHKLIL